MDASLQTLLEKHFGTVDYAVYQAYLDSGKKDRTLFVQFADNAINVLTKTGTTLIDNAPIMEMKKEILSVSKEFFALPEATRQQFVFPGYNERGYLGYGAKKKKDFKNMFHIDSAIYKAMCGVDFKNIKDVHNPDALKKMTEIKNHVPSFNDTAIKFSQRGYEMGHAFCEVLAHYFELPAEYALQMKDGNSLLRMLHYMPFDKSKLENIEGVTRASAHADVSAFTFLLTSDQPGLQVATKKTIHEQFGTNFISNDQMGTIPAKKWLSVPTGKDQCIMNIGRQVEILTNGILPATPHQVVPVRGQEGQERFSIPFFYHLPWNANMEVWQKAIDLRNGNNYFRQKTLFPINIGDYVLNDEFRRTVEHEWPVPVYQP